MFLHFSTVALSLDSVLRIVVALIGIGGIGVAVYPHRREFRWGRSGQGPRVEPQWVGRLFFAFVGSLLLYCAVFKLK